MSKQKNPANVKNGGKIIGNTKSGKPIYDTANHPSHKNFTDKDHEDAADIHRNRQLEIAGHSKNRWYDKKAIHHGEQLSRHMDMTKIGRKINKRVMKQEMREFEDRVS